MYGRMDSQARRIGSVTSNSVGRPGASRKDDVMLVQALFNFVAKRRAGDTSLLGFAIAHAPNEGCCMHDGRNDTRSAVGIPVVRSC